MTCTMEHTARYVPGKNTMVSTAMDFMAEESLMLASAISRVSIPSCRFSSLLLSARKLYT